MTIQIIDHAFNPYSILENYQQTVPRAKFGATSIFIGTMRDFNEGDTVQAMTLEHYAGMTEKQLAKIVDEANAQWQLLDSLIVHRVGDILPNDSIVLVAVWTAHRAEAFAASRYIMEALKTRATFWKKECLNQNNQRWLTKNT